jgi:hypothetical protein
MIEFNHSTCTVSYLDKSITLAPANYVFLCLLYKKQLDNNPLSRFDFANDALIEEYFDICEQLSVKHYRRMKRDTMKEVLWFDERKSRCNAALETIGLKIVGVWSRPRTVYWLRVQ